MCKRLDNFKYSLISLAFSILSVEIIFQYFESFNFKKFILRTLLVIIYYCIFNELNYRRIYSNRNLMYFISHNIFIFFIIIIFLTVLENVLGPLETEYFFHGKYILSTFVLSVILYISTVNFFSKIYAYIIFTLCLLLYCFEGYENKFIIYLYFICFFLLLLVNKGIKLNYKRIFFIELPLILLVFIISLILPTLNILHFDIFGEGNESKYKSQGENIDIYVSKNKNNDNILYTFKGDNPKYFISEVYDCIKNNQWIQSNKDLFSEYIRVDNVKNNIGSTSIYNSMEFVVEDMVTNREYYDVDFTKAKIETISNISDKIKKIKEAEDERIKKVEVTINTDNNNLITYIHPNNDIEYNFNKSDWC